MTNCPQCGTPMTHTNASSPAKCHVCHDPVHERKQSRKVASHSFSTPLGRLHGQLQIDGRWAIVYQIPASNRSEVDLENIKQLADRLLKIECVELARPHSFDQHALCFYWKIPKDFSPLSNVRTNPSSEESQLIIRNITGGLRKLHQAGLAAFYLAPEYIFVNSDFDQAVLIPLPWLAELASHSPDTVQKIAFLAPETGRAPLKEHLDHQSADVYSLGSLARYLITGRQAVESSSLLPSDLRPELQEWDTFIDGCCRSYPERRFSSITAALDALPGSISSKSQNSATEPTHKDLHVVTANHSKSQVPSDEPELVYKPKIRVGKSILLSLVALSFLLILYSNRNWIASIFPVTSSYIGSYQRGFGDTILSYQDRGYVGAAWIKMQDADSLLSLASIGQHQAIKPWRVSGWDDSSYWILCKDGDIFHSDDNHWKYLGSQNNIYNPIGRPLSRSCLLTLGSFYYNTTLYKIENASWTESGELRVGRHYDPSSEKFCIIAPDLSYLLFKDHLTKFEVNSKTKLEADKYKEAFVHRDDNTPLKSTPVDSVGLTKTPKSGTAWGLADESDSDEDILVQFRNGIWYKVDAVKDINPRASWLHGSSSDPDFVVFVGDDGKVLFHELNGSDQLIPITLAQETTSGDLIAVWGVNRNKFWVMDKNGTVWERAENQWRTVIRGMYREDIEFLDAWVSPTGTVIAVTKDAVYRLE